MGSPTGFDLSGKPGCHGNHDFLIDGRLPDVAWTVLTAEWRVEVERG